MLLRLPTSKGITYPQFHFEDATIKKPLKQSFNITHYKNVVLFLRFVLTFNPSQQTNNLSGRQSLSSSLALCSQLTSLLNSPQQVVSVGQFERQAQAGREGEINAFSKLEWLSQSQASQTSGTDSSRQDVMRMLKRCNSFLLELLRPSSLSSLFVCSTRTHPSILSCKHCRIPLPLLR